MGAVLVKRLPVGPMLTPRGGPLESRPRTRRGLPLSVARACPATSAARRVRGRTPPPPAPAAPLVSHASADNRSLRGGRGWSESLHPRPCSGAIRSSRLVRSGANRPTRPKPLSCHFNYFCPRSCVTAGETMVFSEAFSIASLWKRLRHGTCISVSLELQSELRPVPPVCAPVERIS